MFNINKKILLTSFACLFLVTGCSSKQSESEQSQLIKVPAKKIEKTEKTESLYEKERKDFLTKTMYSPKIPVKTPDKIIRVLTMPYVDEENNLQTENYHFVKVDEGRWVLGEYLNGQDRTQNKTLTPLK